MSFSCAMSQVKRNYLGHFLLLRCPVRIAAACHQRWTADCYEVSTVCLARTFNVIEVCQRNILSGFRAHSNIPESKASVLISLATKSATSWS